MTEDRERIREEIIASRRNHPEDWEIVAEVQPAPDDAPRPKVTIAIRLDADDVDRVRQHAEGTGVGYTTLLRQWVLERLDAEEEEPRPASASAPAQPGPSHEDVLVWSYSVEKATKALRELMTHHTDEDLRAARHSLSLLTARPTAALLTPPGPLADGLTRLQQTHDDEAFVDGVIHVLVQATLGRHGVSVGFEREAREDDQHAHS